MGRFGIKTSAMALVLGFAAATAHAAGETSSVPGPPPGFAESRPDTVREVGGIGERKEIRRREIKGEMARVGREEVPGLRRWEREKSPKVAMVSSMLLPGLGQLYNGRRLKTMIAVGVFSYYLGTAWFEEKKAQEYLVTRDMLPPNTIVWKNQDILYQFHKENAVTYLWWSGAAWLITVLDAYVDAHLYDVRAVTPVVVRGAGDTKYIALSIGF